MKSKLLTLLCIGMITVFYAHGQEPIVETYVNDKTGKTEVKTTSLKVDESFAKVITVEIKTAGGLEIRKTVYKKDLKGNWVKADTCYDPPGRYTRSIETYFDKDLKYVRHDVSKLTPKGEVKVKSPYTRPENPSPFEEAGFRHFETELENVRKKAEKDFNQQVDSGQSPCEKDQNCSNTSELFLGYSYLNAGGEGENTSFPLGAHLAMTYLLTKQFGLVADASFHTKKENEVRIMRAFLMGGVQYHLMKEREKRLLVYLRLMAGLAMDRQKYSVGEGSNTAKANAFALAAGLGLSYPVNSTVLLTLMPDYILTFFNEETQGNIRISAGIKINLGCKNK